jgi:hypothetical protein
VTGFHTVLSRELAEQRPQQGDRIGIRYQGRVEGDRPYESYRVAVERAEQPQVPIDWDSIERAAKDEIGDKGEEEPF